MAGGAVSIVRVGSNHPALRALHKETLPSDVLPQWGAGWWWLGFDEQTPVCFGGIQPSARWGDAMYLVRAGVVESHRGQGLQRRLIRVRERHARSLNMSWLVTSTLDNPASANSLIDSGFKLYEPAVPWGAKGTLYWRKQLAA